MKKVVFATDFSENSGYVSSFLKAISLREELEILLLHVFPDIYGMYGPFISQFAGIITSWERAKSRAEQMLSDWEGRLRAMGFKVSSTMLIGDPVSETLKEAEVFKADLIAVGTRGFSGFKGFLIGSFAKSLLHMSPIPVLTLRFPHSKLDKILVPVDLSSSTDTLIRYLTSIENWGEITIYHAVVVDFILDNREREEYRRQILNELPTFKNAQRVVEVEYSPTLDYAGVIVNFAERNHYDVIVLTSHGRSGIQKVIFGSVAESIISRSHVPVLTLNVRHFK